MDRWTTARQKTKSLHNVDEDTNTGDDAHGLAVDSLWVLDALVGLHEEEDGQDPNNKDGHEGSQDFCAMVSKGVALGGRLL